jgi:hypothetical protein
MVIVGGTFEVDPSQREQFLADRVAMMRASRAEPGCIEYTFAADPVEPGRIVLYERWESQEALDAHLVVVRSGPQPSPAVQPISSSIVIYDIKGERKLGR